MFAIGLLSVPYNAAIIAHEKMGVYAYFTLFDAFSRLAIIFAIKYYGGDKLILLAIISIIPTLIKQFYYWYYSKKHFEECTYHAVWDKRVFKEMFGFAGWNFIGASSAQMKDQGVNIAINMFTNPAVNAARGIAMQINGIVGQFIGNFMVAINPQITKEYAAGNYDRMHKLIFSGTRFSYFLFMFLSIPIIFEIDRILYIWLGQVPEHTVLFTRLALILSLSDIISNTLITAQLATGKIRNYQIIVGGTQMMNFPISYILLRMGIFPEITIIVAIFISQICLLERLLFLRKMVHLPSLRYFKEVYLNLIVVTVLSVAVPGILYFSIENEALRFFAVCISSVITSAAVTYTIGLQRNERVLVVNRIKKWFRK
jgi:O-antigen/teichoic acid export membrane protein